MEQNQETPHLESLLSKDFVFFGKLSFQGKIHVEGQLHGSIKGDEDSMIRNLGTINGNVSSHSIFNDSVLDGNFKLKDIAFTQNSSFTGTLESDTISVEKGANISGKINFRE